MATIQLQGEDLRKAVKWISDERIYNTKATLQQLIEDACIRFDLSPKDAEFLGRFMREEAQE
ncbi:MAG: hypothetical protein GY749_32140 [Desulfobacteraceae bacterium]|nr:hypothetical protein [Desulfobacteraceae bacterium]